MHISSPLWAFLPIRGVLLVTVLLLGSTIARAEPSGAPLIDSTAQQLDHPKYVIASKVGALSVKSAHTAAGRISVPAVYLNSPPRISELPAKVLRVGVDDRAIGCLQRCERKWLHGALCMPARLVTPYDCTSFKQT